MSGEGTGTQHDDCDLTTSELSLKPQASSSSSQREMDVAASVDKETKRGREKLGEAEKTDVSKHVELMPGSESYMRCASARRFHTGCRASKRCSDSEADVTV